MTQPLVQKTLAACRNALRDAELKTSEIDGVVMVGGVLRACLTCGMRSVIFRADAVDKHRSGQSGRAGSGDSGESACRQPGRR